MTQNNTGIKAIDTKYRGYNFRSRLEARWAIYLDTVGLNWEYEPEGFDLEGERYLPDFLVKWVSWKGISQQVWLEVKNAPASWELLDCPGKEYETEIRKAKKLSFYTKTNVVFGFGIPSNYCLYGVYYDGISSWEDLTFAYGVMCLAGFFGSEIHERGCIAARSARFEFESFHQSL